MCPKMLVKRGTAPWKEQTRDKVRTQAAMAVAAVVRVGMAIT